MTSVSTTVKKARAWVPATVTTLLAIVLVFGSALLWEILDDQGVDALRDPESVLGAFVYGPLAPLGSPGIVGDADFGDSIVQLLGGLVPVVVVVFLFTWVAARSGSALSTLFGAWLGAVLGTGLGALVSFEIFLRRNDLTEGFFGLQQARFIRLDNGLYWGAAAGLLLGLVAMLALAVSRPRAEGEVAEPTPAPADTGELARPADPAPADPAPGDPAPTTAVPAQSDRPAPPPGPFAPPDKTAVRSDHTP